jgi:hypothetical protein
MENSKSRGVGLLEYGPTISPDTAKAVFHRLAVHT